MAKIALGSTREAAQPDSIKALVIEFITTFFFVGSAITAGLASRSVRVSALRCPSFPSLQATIPTITLGSGVGFLQGVVYATMVDPKKGSIDRLGPLLTGLVVGANILPGGPFSGASMNPAISFGPALVSMDWTDHWVYWVGPLFGGGLAGFIYENFLIERTHHHLSNEEAF